jgi:glutamate synthase domain-containing protein 3
MGFFKSLALFLSGDVNKAKENLEITDELIRQEEESMLLENLQGGLDILYQESILPEERVSVRLQGCMGEALVVTDRRVIILKAGYPAGSLFA